MHLLWTRILLIAIDHLTVGIGVSRIRVLFADGQKRKVLLKKFDRPQGMEGSS